MKKIAIEMTAKSFLPEAYFYQKLLNENGYKCELVKANDDYAARFDAVILFHGFHPFWKRYPKIVIGEYHSLSTGKFPSLKNYLKVAINIRSQLYIFLNKVTMNAYGFDLTTNYILRPMGFDQSLIVKNNEKEFDLVYVGSFRVGLDKVLESLSNMGLTVAVAGFALKGDQYNNITFFGHVGRAETFQLISRAYCGLNFIPDIWPWNIQDSTKVVEYCASGLPVVTNRYEWVNNFEKERNGVFMSLSDLKSKSELYNFSFRVPDVSDLEWNTLLVNNEFIYKINQLFDKRD